MASLKSKQDLDEQALSDVHGDRLTSLNLNDYGKEGTRQQDEAATQRS